MRFDLLTAFMFLTSVYGIITGIILFFFPKHDNYNKRLLSVSLFSFSWYCLVAATFHSNVIIQFPHLFRTSVPFIYLVAPASYLYVRATLHGETRPRSRDWLHLVPVAFVLLELMPFYMKDAAYKLQNIDYYRAHREELVYLREGFLEKHFHFMFRILLGLTYFYFQWQIIRKFLAQTSQKIKVKHEMLLNWLKVFTWLMTASYCLILFTNVFNLYLTKPRDLFNTIISLHLFIISIVLFFKPEVLYSLHKEMAIVTREIPRLEKDPEGTTSKKCAIDDLLLIQQQYLIKGYTLSSMAAELNMSKQTLSAIINAEYQMNFTDLINKHRVEYIISRIHEGKTTNYTFEGMALEAGFNSRTTFYRAFYKVTGQTPSEFLKNSR